MKMAPVSSRRLEMRPPSRAVKNVSGMEVSVWRDVEKLWARRRRIWLLMAALLTMATAATSRLSRVTYRVPPTFRFTMSPP